MAYGFEAGRVSAARLRRMKGLKSWAKVHEVSNGFAASIKDTTFITI